MSNVSQIGIVGFVVGIECIQTQQAQGAGQLAQMIVQYKTIGGVRDCRNGTSGDTSSV